LDMGRRGFVGGNWKLNGTRQSIQQLVSNLNQAPSLSSSSDVDVVVFPSFVYLDYVSGLVSNQKYLVGAQNAWSHDSGAFTGEVSPTQLRDIGINWVILGHSERRHINHESNELIGLKVGAAQRAGLGVVLCIGELLDEREKNQTLQVVTSQLEATKQAISNWERVVIAYEPVWAIGTGKVATQAQAQEVHHQIRSWLAEHVSQSVAEQTRIIYGGSVKAENSKELASCPDVDGFLVGGASLIADQFIQIVNSMGKE